MPQRLCHDGAFFAACHHQGCYFILADEAELSRHYRVVHREKRPRPAHLVSDSLVWQLVLQGHITKECYNQKMDSRQNLRNDIKKLRDGTNTSTRKQHNLLPRNNPTLPDFAKRMLKRTKAIQKRREERKRSEGDAENGDQGTSLDD
jgi:hypothetical protein